MNAKEPMPNALAGAYARVPGRWRQFASLEARSAQLKDLNRRSLDAMNRESYFFRKEPYWNQEP